MSRLFHQFVLALGWRKVDQIGITRMETSRLTKRSRLRKRAFPPTALVQLLGTHPSMERDIISDLWIWLTITLSWFCPCSSLIGFIFGHAGANPHRSSIDLYLFPVRDSSGAKSLSQVGITNSWLILLRPGAPKQLLLLWILLVPEIYLLNPVNLNYDAEATYWGP